MPRPASRRLGFRGRAAGERSERTPKAQPTGTQPPPGPPGLGAAAAGCR